MGGAGMHPNRSAVKARPVVRLVRQLPEGVPEFVIEGRPRLPLLCRDGTLEVRVVDVGDRSASPVVFRIATGARRGFNRGREVDQKSVGPM